MAIIHAALVASLILLVLSAAGASLKRSVPRSDLFRHAAQLHLSAFFLLAALTILTRINQEAGIPIPHAIIVTTALLPLLALSALRTLLDPHFPDLTYWISIWAKMFLLCLLSASTYAIVRTPDSHSFIPALDNNDIFPYLLRASAFLPWQSGQMAADIGGNTPQDLLSSSSKFASALFLAFFKSIISSPAMAATAAMTAVKAVIIHLFWSVFRSQRPPTIAGLAWLTFLAFLPTLDLAGLRFHLSQLMFIYVAAMSMLFVDKLFLGPLYRTLFSVCILVTTVALLYPVALPLYGALAFAALIGHLYINRKPLPWQPVLLLAAALVAGYLLITTTLLQQTDYYHHIEGSYYPMNFLPLTGHLLAPIGFRVFGIGLTVSTALPALIAIDLLLIIVIIRLALRFSPACSHNRAMLSLLLLVGTTAGYLTLYALSDGNYRAYKFGTTAVTLAVLFMGGNMLHISHQFPRKTTILTLALVTAINIAGLSYTNMDRSIPSRYDNWARAINEEKRETVICDFSGYNVNMYLPLVLHGVSLYSLRDTYYSSSPPAGTTTVFTDRPISDITARVIRCYPGEIREIRLENPSATSSSP
ncbi:hypothetical protein CR163_002910 [Prosthecochloris sp. ZM_2]|uniref:hypothetical protein n=1 Tax=Prosthecochloris sp. ZM_2 TaxID=2045206 RepID=UPI000DF85147|nr:hypothetical protein [Prosthecochloris sp. ZM_2]RNA64287.1 hypothetical protein CR163_002910 [Prosthecochloris sp. ZM_2]